MRVSGIRATPSYIACQCRGRRARAGQQHPHVDTESLDQNDVAQFTDSWHKSEGGPEYELFGNLGEPDSGPLFTYRLMEELVFSHARGRFRNWWYADMYDDLLVLYPPFKVEGVTPKPVKAWRRYDQVWSAEG